MKCAKFCGGVLGIWGSCYGLAFSDLSQLLIGGEILGFFVTILLLLICFVSFMVCCHILAIVMESQY
jgi:hypothetical protein